jgi:lysophospholipase L1-like esterase
MSKVVRYMLVIAGLVLSCEASSQDPGRWEQAVRAFASQETKSAAPANAILFVGSSSIVKWETLRQDMAPLTVINHGFGGSTMGDLVHWLEPVVLKYRPRAVVLYEGDNDVGQYQAKPEQVLEQFKRLVSQIHAELPETRIYFLAIKPSVLRWAAWPIMMRTNELVRAMSSEDDLLVYVDVASPMLDERGQPRADLFEADQLHMNARGYELWSVVLKPILLKREGSYEQHLSN